MNAAAFTLNRLEDSASHLYSQYLAWIPFITSVSWCAVSKGFPAIVSKKQNERIAYRVWRWQGPAVIAYDPAAWPLLV